MLTKAIRELLARQPGPAPGPERAFDIELLAAAALMVECARIDGEFSEQERDAICHAVREAFSLDRETAEQLVAVAERHEDEMWDNWLFTETIKRHFSPDEQLEIIGRLWDVAMVEDLHPFEEHLVASVARELNLTEEAVSQSREQAQQRRAGRKQEPRE
mgnify:CR=1 FL=1